MPNEAGGGTPTTNAVRNATPNGWTVTIGGVATIVDGDDYIVTETGEIMTVEMAVGMGLPILRTTLTAAEQQRVANRATGSTGQPPAADPEPGKDQTAGSVASSTPVATEATSSGSASPTAAAAQAEPVEERTDDGLNQIPEDALLWAVGGRVYAAYELKDPRTGEVEGYVGWYIDDPATLSAIQGDSGRGIDRTLTPAEAAALGFQDRGVVSEIKVADGGNANLLENFYEDWAETYSGSPLMGDDEILALTIAATLENRQVTDNELKGTQYYLNTTPDQRAWLDLVGLDVVNGTFDIDDLSSAEAEQVRDNNRESVAAALQARGYNVPQTYINYLADQLTTGRVTEAQLERQIIQDTDPYAAGASPFAGITDWSSIDPSWRVVTDGEGYWVRTKDGDYQLDGPGQVALFGGVAEQISGAAPAGRHVVENGVHYLLLDDGGVLKATGGGQIAGLERLYGPAQEHQPGHFGRPDSGSLEDAVTDTVVNHFGGEGGIERVGDISQVGTGANLAEQVSGGQKQTTALGQEERVRTLLYQWLGPMFAAGYTDTWVAEWAGRLRNGGPGEVDMLTQELRGARSSLLPNYDENLTYDQIASPWRGLWQSKAGVAPSEDKDSDFLAMIQGNDYQGSIERLNTIGIQRGWAPTVLQAAGQLAAGLGSQVRSAF